MRVARNGFPPVAPRKSRLVGHILTKAELIGIVKTVKTTPLVTLADES
jgi:hypothetical protein